MMFTQAHIDAAFASDDDELQRMMYAAVVHPYYTFEPRPDCPDEFDEQDSFVNDSTSKLSICLGGTGSGKTIAAAFKTAKYVLETPPPRDRCPFWIVGGTYDQVCQVAWSEKLSTLIPASEIHGYVWYRARRQWPYAVMLRRPEPDRRHEIGWILEFKSYEQGFGGMKAVSIGGYWCNEEIPYHLLFEIQGRCRDYNSPGWADFTPVECKDAEWPEAYEAPPEGWRFYHLNNLKNDAVPEGSTTKVSDWAKGYLATVPDDMRELRQIGRFTILQGAAFKEFRKAIHVVEPFDIPRDWYRIRGMDFGYNNPTCCLWIARDRDQRYYVYDEHYKSGWLHAQHAEAINSRRWEENNPHYGPTFSDHASQDIAEYRKLGINCTLARKSPNAAIEFVRSLMMLQGDSRPKVFIFKNCENLIKEIPGIRYANGTANRNPSDLPIDKDNHAVDAMLYAIYTDHKRQTSNTITTGRTKRDSRRHGVHLAGRR